MMEKARAETLGIKKVNMASIPAASPLTSGNSLDWMPLSSKSSLPQARPTKKWIR